MSTLEVNENGDCEAEAEEFHECRQDVSDEETNSKINELSDEERKEKTLELKSEGNSQFKLGNFESAVEWYTKSVAMCLTEDKDTLAILYSNLAAAKDHLEAHTEAINYCTEALALNDQHLKALLRRAQLYHKCDKLDESLADYERYLELKPDETAIRRTIAELKVQIDERNEKLKAEMLDKLKGLGNMVLKPFGLSTDNFQLVKNEDTGGYSVNFQNKR